MVNQEDSSTDIPLMSGNNPQSQQAVLENGEKTNSLFSPRFKSVVAMAGWDEEALLCASLIVEDTPVRNSKQRKRIDLSNLKSPLTSSRRKRRAQRRTIGTSMPVAVLSLDDDPPAKEETQKCTAVAAPPPTKIIEDEVKKIGASDGKSKSSSVSSSNSVIPCLDKLREELSCAICLEICFEPSTTPCGHSFCKKCLRSAAYKCGKKCPKCRQLISNGRSCTINTVLWNTIQLLFPQEIEARKASDASNGKEDHKGSTQNASVEVVLESGSHGGSNRRSSRHNIRTRSSFDVVRRSNNNPPIQDEDAALALRLQREEFMGVFENRRSDDAPPQRRSSSIALARENLRTMASRETEDAPPQQRSSLALARANLRAMATRATSIRLRRGRTI